MIGKAIKMKTITSHKLLVMKGCCVDFTARDLKQICPSYSPNEFWWQAIRGNQPA